MGGCVSNLYTSVEKLESTYTLAGASKVALLSPTVLSFPNSLLRQASAGEDLLRVQQL